MVCYAGLSGEGCTVLSLLKDKNNVFFFIEDTETDKYFSLTSGNVFFVTEQTGGINKKYFPSALGTGDPHIDHKESNHVVALKIFLLASRRGPGALPLQMKKRRKKCYRLNHNSMPKCNLQ